MKEKRFQLLILTPPKRTWGIIMRKSFGKYISGYIISFIVFTAILALINIFLFGWTFYNTFSQDYGEGSPQNMLDEITAASTATSPAGPAVEKLRDKNIWAMYVNQDGGLFWSVDLPYGVPSHYTLQDVAVFAKGYISDYPVFIRSTENGLIVLGYPPNSYTKLLSNYYSISTIKKLPAFTIIVLVIDFLLLFFAYYLSKQKIIKNTEPITNAIDALSDGKPISLSIRGELSEVAESLNKASGIINKQNEARANWISGVSHDIRTPLSIIMGYADKLTSASFLDSSAREDAEVIKWQSIKIRDLVQDLNLVSQLEYEMQPLNKKKIRFSKLIRAYVADLLNIGLSDLYSIEVEISPQAETIIFECDERLMTRAVSNLIQNSMNHNPQGCKIYLTLDVYEQSILLAVADNGIGISSEKLLELQSRPHYMKSVDERLDLRHGLGLLLVQKIIESHNGSLQIESEIKSGYRTTLIFPSS
ncbi:signal transduction histidine kinase [Kineothrix alysoides]|uniref:histidine kinase n=2 Tax=Kineothrix alysoides TaxID=1469948 RepID=A0A4R1QVL4_9FIRM|nr:signal transduction histidine kinase [Kineothrix alysoides]